MTFKRSIQSLVFKLMRRLERLYMHQRLRANVESGILDVGDYTYGQENINIMQFRGSESNVKIGKFCSIGPNCTIITGGIHRTDVIANYPIRIKLGLKQAYEDGQTYSKGPVEIGNDVWIASNVTILSGVRIGNGAVIAAGSIVTSNVEDYSIVGGIPAREISRKNIDRSKLIEWWDLPKEKIISLTSYLNE